MPPESPRIGVLLVNLGTPRSPEVEEVRRYLRQFLLDPRVIDLPTPLRWLLVHGAILPFRPRASAQAYRSIWTPQGSPLRVQGDALVSRVGDALGPDFRVRLAMRYGEPSIPDAVEALARDGVQRMVALPLFPQYSAAATGSARAALLEAAGDGWDVPPLEILGDFFDLPAFLDAQAEIAAPRLEAFRADHVLMSFHGLPERQIRRSDPSAGGCLATADCCEHPGLRLARCYRAQCFATARGLAGRLGLEPDQLTTCFQSRLGRDPWIQPFTDHVLEELAGRGVRRVAVLCPSFVADCLETVEEIGIRGREQWEAAGGEALELLPCVNDHPTFVKGLAEWIRRAAQPE